jgi:hypothetical protein
MIHDGYKMMGVWLAAFGLVIAIMIATWLAAQRQITKCY